ncbi:MAG: acetyl-CoA carboxylase biotin carboxyl carrier protein [Solirubrobacteraceae bacterium]
MDFKDLQNLIKFISKSEVAEVNYKTDGFELKVKNIPINQPTQYIQGAMPQQVVVAQPISTVSQVDISIPQSDSQTIGNDKFITIKSPMIGTFYRRPSPDKPLFVNVGDDVKQGNVICIIEAMKLFNEIESEFSGKIVKILVEDSMPVEFDQPLFIIDPS